MTSHEGAMPETTINFVNQNLAGLDGQTLGAVHAPMTEAGQQPPADEDWYGAYKPPFTPGPNIEIAPEFQYPSRVIIEGACGDADGIRVSEMNESGQAVPGDYSVNVDPFAMARIAALYRGKMPDAQA